MGGRVQSLLSACRRHYGEHSALVLLRGLRAFGGSEHAERGVRDESRGGHVWVGGAGWGDPGPER